MIYGIKQMPSQSSCATIIETFRSLSAARKWMGQDKWRTIYKTPRGWHPPSSEQLQKLSASTLSDLLAALIMAAAGEEIMPPLTLSDELAAHAHRAR